MSEAIELVAPNPIWAAEFSATKHLLLPCFSVPPRLIEHMGSTAVSGLVAKPIIDIIVLVDALETVRPDIAALEAIGFLHRADYADGTKLVLVKYAADGQRSHHLHVHEDAEEVRRHVLFRDLLRSAPEVRAAYAALKLELAERYRDDRMAYSRHKTAFIDEAVATHGGPMRRVPWNPLTPTSGAAS